MMDNSHGPRLQAARRLWRMCLLAGGVLSGSSLAAALQAAPSASGQSTSAREEVSARVTGFVQGTGIVIDRGVRDGLQVGDRVTFTARGGRQQFGTIVELEGRVATIRGEDPQFRPEPGTRASIVVPTSRFEKPKPDTGGRQGILDGLKNPGTTKVPSTKPSTKKDPKRPPGDEKWTRPDDGFTMDMPLLAEVNAVHPSRRASRLTGRSYASWDRIFDTETGRGDSFLRLGGGVFGENLFGKGGVLHLDGELNARETRVPDFGGQKASNFRLDRLSYTLGGTRHDWNRLQFGRFLQDGMSEFGVLDGASWSTRTGRGDSFGGSLGFLPEPDKDQKSLKDFQVAGWYRWVADEREILSFTGGYQKTWHNGSQDRDLVVLKTQYVPVKGWNVFGSAWIDLYGGGDFAKTSGPGLTYMVVDARRKFENELTLNLDYRHQEYPQLLRADFPPVSLPQIQDAHVDRLGGTVSKWTSGGASKERAKRLYLRAGGWSDEEDTGGDAELGVDLFDLFADDARLDLAVFTSAAKFSNLVGARVRFGRFGPKRSWSVQYEVRQNDIIGFQNGADGLYQHRARGSYQLFRASGLSASLSGEVQFQDREQQLFLGFFLQRSF